MLQNLIGFTVTALPAGINSIIFDLGGVIIDVSVDRTITAFSALTGVSETDIQKVYATNPVFKTYERGEVSDDEFRDFIRNLFLLPVRQTEQEGIQASDAEIDRCWNAMLINLPVSTLKMLEALKNRFNVFVLSNTNAIHLNYVHAIMLQGRVLDSWVHKAYYSHQLGLRKPELEIYQHVLIENKLIPEKTIFLDDNLENIKAADSLNIQTIHITHLQQVPNLFNFV